MMRRPKYGRALNAALAAWMEQDERVIMLGEDIADPYGGAFKITRGLSARFPDRVRNTPISEAGIVGVAVGLALRGRRPVVEIMFGDFVGLAFDALVNHAAKCRAVYGQPCGMVVRMVSGAGRGYGATHSQCLEKHLLGVPGLVVEAASAFMQPSDQLAGLPPGEPVVWVEDKRMYASEIVPVPAPPPGARLTLAAYGGLASRIAAECDLSGVELVPVTRLSDGLPPAVAASVARTGRLLAVEDGAGGFGWAAGLVAEAGAGRALSGPSTVIPVRGEGEAIMNTARVQRAIEEETCGRR